MKEGWKPEYPEKSPGDEFQKIPHTKARGFKPQARLKPAQKHWWQARKADVLTATPCVAPNQTKYPTMKWIAVSDVPLYWCCSIREKLINQTNIQPVNCIVITLVSLTTVADHHDTLVKLTTISLKCIITMFMVHPFGSNENLAEKKNKFYKIYTKKQ